MDNSIITGAIELWGQQLNLLVRPQELAEKSAILSNLILGIYAIYSAVTGKSRLIAAFVLCEVVAATYPYTSVAGYEIFLINSFIYCLVYRKLLMDKSGLKTQLSCAIMVIFQAGMCIDAIVNSEVETLIYSSYEYIVLLIHLFIISSLLPWQRIRLRMGDIARALYDKLRYSDAVAYICYNCQT